MEFSLSSYCLFENEIVETLETLAEHTEFVELMYEAKHASADAKLLQEYPLSYSIHSPFIGMNLSSLDEKQWEFTIQSIKKSIDLASEVDAELVVIHPGTYNQEQDKEKAVNRMRDALSGINKYALDCGVPLVLENMGNWTDWGINILQNPDEIPADMDFCLDIGHANLCGSLPGFLDKPFQHIHIHDNHGITDEHDAVGTGTIDMNKVVDAIKMNKIVHPVIECCTLEKSLVSLETLKKIL